MVSTPDNYSSVLYCKSADRPMTYTKQHFICARAGVPGISLRRTIWLQGFKKVFIHKKLLENYSCQAIKGCGWYKKYESH